MTKQTFILPKPFEVSHLPRNTIIPDTPGFDFIDINVTEDMTKDQIRETMLDNFFINSLKEKYRIVGRPQWDGSVKYSLYATKGKKAISHTVIREEDIEEILSSMK